PEATALLIAGLRDSDDDVRAEAARGLGDHEGTDAALALVDALDDPSQAVRDAVAEALANRGDPAIGTALLARLSHADAFVRAGVLRAMRDLALPEASAPAVIALTDSAPEVRLQAVGVLGYLRDAAHVPGLARLAADLSAAVRRAVM